LRQVKELFNQFKIITNEYKTKQPILTSTKQKDTKDEKKVTTIDKDDEKIDD